MPNFTMVFPLWEYMSGDQWQTVHKILGRGVKFSICMPKEFWSLVKLRAHLIIVNVNCDIWNQTFTGFYKIIGGAGGGGRPPLVSATTGNCDTT